MSLISLSTEILHKIFDNIDIGSIFSSIRLVCKYLNSVVNSYNRFQFDCKLISKNDIKIICRLIEAERFTSIILSNIDPDTIEKNNLFLSISNIYQFKRIRSLTLIKINDEKLNELLLYAMNCNLVSLTIEFIQHESQNIKIFKFLSSLISQKSLRKLSLNKFDYIMQHITLPIESFLNELIVDSCIFNQYHIILYRFSHLRLFKLKNFNMNNIIEKSISSSINTNYSQLTSLIITHYSLNIEELKIIVSLTPSLAYLKIISIRKKIDSFFDGYIWEKFLQNELLHLCKFEFYIDYQFYYDQKNISPTPFSIINSFCSSYWLNQNRYNIICDYNINFNRISVYTTPICAIENDILKQISFSNATVICRINNHMINEIVNGLTGIALTTLPLNVPFTYLRMNYLADSLRNNTTITHLIFRQFLIDHKAIDYITQALTDNTTLTKISMERNEIGDKGIYILTDYLEKIKALTTLVVENNQVTVKGAQYLADCLKMNRTLKNLYLDYNQIGSRGAHYLAEALKHNNTLTTLSLCGNQIRIPGIRRIAEALKYNTSLTTLILKSNVVAGRGMQYLIDGLKNNTTLTVLNLRQTYLKEKGAKYLAELLRNNQTLTQLNVEENFFTNAEIKYLVDIIRNNRTLTTLALGFIKIGEQGTQSLLDALRNNTTLTSLSLESNEIDDEVAKQISDILKNNAIHSE